jgi:tRNA modification GTPase
MPASWSPSTALGGRQPVCEISSITVDGFESLLACVSESLGCSTAFCDAPRVTNERHIQLLRRCSRSIGRALEESYRLGVRAPEELLLFELADARAALSEIAGARTADDVLERIFERFCVGK